MKKLLLFTCFLLLLTPIYAQKEFQEKEISIDSMLVNIDKAAITSGILYDRVHPWASLTSFNDNPENTSSVKHFEQALHELYKASNKHKFTNYEELRKKYVSKKQKNSVDVGILNASFQQLNYNPENESTGGLRLTENKFEQIEGKTPFLNNHTFIVAPLKAYLRGKTITYNFDNSLVSFVS